MVECEICHKKEEWNGPNSYIYRFEPKRNYAEDLEDTEESDNTSSDDDNIKMKLKINLIQEHLATNQESIFYYYYFKVLSI